MKHLRFMLATWRRLPAWGQVAAAVLVVVLALVAWRWATGVVGVVAAAVLGLTPRETSRAAGRAEASTDALDLASDDVRELGTVDEARARDAHADAATERRADGVELGPEPGVGPPPTMRDLDP